MKMTIKIKDLVPEEDEIKIYSDEEFQDIVKKQDLSNLTEEILRAREQNQEQDK